MDNAPTLMQYLDERFNALDEKLDTACRVLDGHEVRIRALEVTHSCAMVVDHEKRIRSIERQTSWQWVAQLVGGVAAVFGIRTGFGE